MELLERSAAVLEVQCKPIEQFVVARPPSHFAEIVRSFDNPAAEVIMPNPIHDGAPGQWILWIGDPARQSGTAFAFILRMFNGEARWQIADERERARHGG